MKTTVKLNELNSELLCFPPYSPDLASSDDWLFADTKRMLQKKWFGSNKEMIAGIESKDKSIYEKSVKKLGEC